MKDKKLEIGREELFDVNMMITISVTVSGSADHPALETAFRKAVSSFEVLNTRIVIDKTGTAYYEPCDRQENRLFYTEKSLQEVICEQEKIRFRVENGEYLRLFVNDLQQETLQLYFLMHHTAGDGKSLCYFIEGFLRCLNTETFPDQPLQLLKESDLPENSRLRLPCRLYINRWNRKWKRKESIFGFDELQKAFSSFWQQHETETQFSTVSHDDLQKQLKACHKNGISFTAHYISELLKETATEKKVGLAVSIRRAEDRSMGNRVTGIQINASYNREKDFTENAKEINRRLKAALTDPQQRFFVLRFLNAFSPSLINALMLECAGTFHSSLTEKLAEIIHYAENAKDRNDFSITNLGILDIPTEYGGYRIRDLWFIPPTPFYARDVIGMVTVNGLLHITRHRYKSRKRVTIVTGAAGGLGKAFVKQLIRETDELWAIGRNEEKLDQLRAQFGDKIKPLPMDLSDIGNLQLIKERLQSGEYTVICLVNNAGSGRMDLSENFSAAEIQTHVTVHDISPAVLCNICIPYMEKGSHILNVASQAAFQPLPGINLYAAGKAFCCSYSRALNRELKDRGIAVTAVCPGWIRTELLKYEINGRPVHYPHLAEPEAVAEQALKDAGRGKDMSVYSSYVRCLRFYSKVLPHALTMRIWEHAIGK